MSVTPEEYEAWVVTLRAAEAALEETRAGWVPVIPSDRWWFISGYMKAQKVAEGRLADIRAVLDSMPHPLVCPGDWGGKCACHLAKLKEALA